VVAFAGVDYSMTSPAMVIYDDTKPFCFENCHAYYMTMTKKYETHFANVTGVHFEYSSQMDRFDKISEYFLTMILHHKATVVYIEDYSMGSKGKVFHIGENTGIFKYKVWNEQNDVVGVPPTVIKKFATGKGNSNKERMEESFKEENPKIDLKFELNMTARQWNPSSDIIDAYYVCKYAHDQHKLTEGK
jgi:Holliday junction resolvasome RuvABC endonuclease subunit